MIYCSWSGLLLASVATHSSLEGTQTSRFDIRRLVGEPETCGHVYDEADRVAVFNLSHSHALDVALGALLQLLLHRRERDEQVRVKGRTANPCT